MFAVSDAKKAAYTINRYIIDDTTKKAFLRFDTLQAAVYSLENGMAGMDSADASKAIAVVKERAQNLLNDYPHRTALNMPVLFAKVFPYIYWGNGSPAVPKKR